MVDDKQILSCSSLALSLHQVARNRRVFASWGQDRPAAINVTPPTSLRPRAPMSRRRLLQILDEALHMIENDSELFGQPPSTQGNEEPPRGDLPRGDPRGDPPFGSI